MKRWFLACLIGSLAGCTTTGDIMQRAPVAQFTSTKPAAQVSGCIAPRIFKGWGQSKVTPSGAGSMIIVSGSAWGNPMAIIDVQPGSPGANIAIRRGGMVSDHVFNDIVAAAAACR